jgi:EAL domain-containing protein (putative c-di-GMP-specific phosphodiesterase class I)
MDFNFFFDIAALSILLFLVFSIILKKQLVGLSNKIYLRVLGLTFLCAIFDILASLPFLPIPVLTVLNTFFLLLRGCTAASLFIYACNLGQTYYRLRKRPWLYLVIFSPLLIFLVFLVINFFNQSMFVYFPTEVGAGYARGPLIWIAYGISYLYLSFALVLVFASQKYHSKAQLIAMLIAFLLQVSASVIQYLVPGILIEMFMTSLTLLTLSLFIESPENFIDYKTRSLSYRIFIYDMKRRLDLRDSFNILFIHVTNTASLYNLYPHEQAMAFNQACCAAMKAQARAIDPTAEVYYLGNGTFAYVYDHPEVAKDLSVFAQDEFAEPMDHNGISFLYHAKFCTVHCPEDCHKVTDLIAFSTTFFDLTDKDVLHLTPFRKEEGNVLFELDHILEKATREQSFSAYYQGIYSLKEKKFIAAEALMRLVDPTYGLLMPGMMIPYAEGRGKIVAMSKIIMEKAFAFFVEHLRGKLRYIEINLSSYQLLDPRLASDVRDLAYKYDIKPEEIVFEVTETTATTEDFVPKKNINALLAQGYRLAIDDFGTGYSNLSRLLQFNISILKFDRTMTDLLATGKQDDFFNGLFTIFRQRGIKILFEGVETKEVADKLEKMGADHIQGFYYSKTIPEDDFLKLIEK